MKIKRTFCALFLSLILFNVHAYAKSPVWKISKDGNHLFIGGTIHLLSQSDYPLPGAFEHAYKNSKLLVLETDLQKFSSPEFQPEIIKSSVYTGEQNITQFLKPDTLRDLEHLLTNRGIPLEAIIKLKPGMLSVTLTVLELQRLGLAGTGVDQFFSLRALNDSREIKYLETVSEQLEFISSMGEGNEDAFIEYMLSDLKNLPALLGTTKEAWKNGDNDRLRQAALDPWKERFPKLYNSMLVKRNNNWVPQIERMLKTKEVEFVLFGALHLAGEQGVLAQLKALGYKVENQ